ncbi:hypothetical protein VFPPC_13238 [Pochonia chlamydosporia 170]|uniref:RdRP-like PH domain-containing protein n=1 Tax=Pochonia chlamydosporia 170 TaxID=1380566 RepID=A0A179FVJ4_METCM|nr:hypothetical protein VFPPC_13238 [Pochonia chlamydosporia 170]OAQ69675.1 hypothetical protein VFPPC_13238 [Pochonia chlamydosporia 170]
MGLKFIQQTHLRIGGYSKFGRQCLTILAQDNRIDIPFNTVQELIANHASQSMMLVLEEAPRFYSQALCLSDNNAKWERQASCPSWKDHAKCVAHCLVYQLIPMSEYYPTIRALKAQDILSLSQRNIPVKSSPVLTYEDCVPRLSACEGKMQSLGTAREGIIPIPILFQVQSLIWDNYLHPYGGLCTLDIIERIARDSTRVIKILQDTGTNPQWFVAQQDNFLKDQGIGSALGLPSFIKQLDRMRIDYRRDRFLKSVVEHAVLREQVGKVQVD